MRDSEVSAAVQLLRLCICLGLFVAKGSFQEPEFAEAIPNITVVAGREALLPCVVSNLGTYKVAWIHYERSAILTVHNHVITRNPRIHVSNSNHRGWILKISDIRETDKGTYMCQINTEPVKIQIGYVTVVVPPNIIDSETSSEVNAMEHSSTVLRCRAKGTPPPTISWAREDGEKLVLAKNKEVDTVIGELLEIAKVSRLHMGAYLCIASNGIPPSVSKRIQLKVDFHPHLMISHQLVGAPLGYSALLECHVEAHPRSINYWAREDGHMLLASDKYDIYHTEKGYTLEMHLKIKALARQDYGVYKCIVKNPLGETDGQITLYETDAPSTLSTAPPTLGYGKIEDLARHKNDNFSSYRNNPSSLIVQDNDSASRLNLKSASNRTKEGTLSVDPPRDWSRAARGHCTVLASLPVTFIVVAALLAVQHARCLTLSDP